MSAWQNLKIGVKVYLGFFAVLVVLMALGFFSIWNFGVINDQSTEISKNWLPALEYASALNTAAGDYRAAESKYIIAEADADMKDAAAKLQKIGGEMADLRKRYEALIASDHERALYQQFSDAWAKYQETSKQLFALEEANNDEGSVALFVGQSEAQYEAASGLLDQLVDLNHDGGMAASAMGDQVYASSRSLLIGGMVAAIL